MNWRYLLPNQDIRIRQHRHLWWSAPTHFPRPLWLLLELWLWLRWISLDAWRDTWRAVRILGPEIKKNEGLSLKQQAWRTLTLSLAWCIPPKQIYVFKLYRNSSSVLDYIFDHETAAYHAWRSHTLGFTRSSLALIQDKQALSQKFTEAGLPMVPTHTCIPRSSTGSLRDWFKTDTKLFCKTRSGSRGIGAFSAWQSPNGLRGHVYKGPALDTSETVEAAWKKLLNLDDVLIQPLLQNHPDLENLSAESDAITLRFISRRNAGMLDCLSAILEIPAAHDEKTGSSFHSFLPIDTISGAILAFPPDALISEDDRLETARVASRLAPNALIPSWIEIAKYSCQAHAFFPDIREIAWDWIVTPDGPRLLEGNAGWGAELLQTLQGGLLRGLPERPQ